MMVCRAMKIKEIKVHWTSSCLMRRREGEKDRERVGKSRRGRGGVSNNYGRSYNFQTLDSTLQVLDFTPISFGGNFFFFF